MPDYPIQRRVELKNAAYIARHIRRVLKDGGSAPHAAEVQWFFKEEVASRGWYTAELRKVAVRFRRQLLAESGPARVLEIADQLFRGRVLEEKVFAVFLMESLVKKLGDREFKLFTKWLERVSSWADHDALIHYLIGPMMAADTLRVPIIYRWARRGTRWQRRAAAVSLIRSVRQGLHLQDVSDVTESLLNDHDDMVQKGLGWLLRETAKYNPEFAVPFLMSIRERAPRLVLRTACETLPADVRAKVLAKPARAAGA